MYRIVTENKNAETIKAFLGSFGLDYTVYYCEGSWQGQTENSMVVELGSVSEEIAEAMAQFIKQTNVQQAVLIQNIPVTSRLI